MSQVTVVLFGGDFEFNYEKALDRFPKLLVLLGDATKRHYCINDLWSCLEDGRGKKPNVPRYCFELDYTEKSFINLVEATPMEVLKQLSQYKILIEKFKSHNTIKNIDRTHPIWESILKDETLHNKKCAFVTFEDKPPSDHTWAISQDIKEDEHIIWMRTTWYGGYPH